MNKKMDIKKPKSILSAALIFSLAIIVVLALGAGIWYVTNKSEVTKEYVITDSFEALNLSGPAEIEVVIDSKVSNTLVRITGAKKWVDKTSTAVEGYLQLGVQFKNVDFIPRKQLAINILASQTPLGLLDTQLSLGAFGIPKIKITTPSISALQSFYSAQATVSGECINTKQLELFTQYGGQISVNCVTANQLLIKDQSGYQDRESISVKNATTENVYIESGYEKQSAISGKNLFLTSPTSEIKNFEIGNFNVVNYCIGKNQTITGNKAWYIAGNTYQPDTTSDYCRLDKDGFVLK
jgi:hypothetical protein